MITKTKLTISEIGKASAFFFFAHVRGQVRGLLGFRLGVAKIVNPYIFDIYKNHVRGVRGLSGFTHMHTRTHTRTHTHQQKLATPLTTPNTIL